MPLLSLLNSNRILNINDDWKKRRRKRQASLNSYNRLRSLSTNRSTSATTTTLPRKRKSRILLKYIDEDGLLKTLTPTKTFWYCFYVRSAHILSQKQLKTFRNRFRLPVKQYQELLHVINDAPHFVRWASGKKLLWYSSVSSIPTTTWYVTLSWTRLDA